MKKQVFNPISGKFDLIDSAEGKYLPLDTGTDATGVCNVTIESIEARTTSGDQAEYNITNGSKVLEIFLPDFLDNQALSRGIIEITGFSDSNYDRYYQIIRTSATRPGYYLLSDYVDTLTGTITYTDATVYPNDSHYLANNAVVAASGLVTMDYTKFTNARDLVVGDRIIIGNFPGDQFFPAVDQKFDGIHTLTSVTPTEVQFQSSATTAYSLPILNWGMMLYEEEFVTGNINLCDDPRTLPDYGQNSLVTAQMLDEHTRDLDNPHEVDAATIGLDNLTNDKQVPISGTVQAGVNVYAFSLNNRSNAPDFITPEVDVEITIAGGHSITVGEIITISGSVHWDDTYLVTEINVGGDPDVLRADKQSGPPNFSGTSYATFFYWYSAPDSSAGSATQTITACPVTGNIKFDAQPDTLPGFDSLSVVTEGRLQSELGASSGLATKSGVEAGATFPAGNPRKKAVIFTAPYADANYSVSIIGEDSKIWTVDPGSQTLNGFTINSNSASAVTGNVSWTAIKHGETT